MTTPPLKPPPGIATMDEHSPLRRVHFRLWQISLSGVTVLVTGWSFTLGPMVGIAATFLAKHILVAILAAGLDLPDDEPERRR
jgi:hypothetical protein